MENDKVKEEVQFWRKECDLGKIGTEVENSDIDLESDDLLSKLTHKPSISGLHNLFVSI